MDNGLSKEQRRDIIRRVQGNDALEGYDPITDPKFLELQEQWLQGKITTDQRIVQLKRHYGIKLSDAEILHDVMDTVVSNSEHGVVTEVAAANAKKFKEAGRISWGSENGRIIGVMADGTRCDIDGNIID